MSTWVEVTNPDLGRPISVRVGTIDGRMVCTGLRIDATTDELTARDLRKIRLADIITDVAQSGVVGDAPIRTRVGGRGHSEAHFQHVAEAYERAKRTHPTAPIRAVMSEFSASEASVHRWLKRAADADLKRDSRLLDAEELAERWQVEISHVYRLAREGRIPVVKLGRYYRFRLDVIEEWERTGGANSPFGRLHESNLAE